jgi:hypothetical protein
MTVHLTRRMEVGVAPSRGEGVAASVTVVAWRVCQVVKRRLHPCLVKLQLSITVLPPHNSQMRLYHLR